MLFALPYRGCRRCVSYVPFCSLVIRAVVENRYFVCMCVGGPLECYWVWLSGLTCYGYTLVMFSDECFHWVKIAHLFVWLSQIKETTQILSSD